MSEETALATIEYPDFAKVDIRVGRITAAELVPKSDKLLKLRVDLGSELGTRTIVAGIAKSYDLANVVDQQVLVVVNLAPRKLMGIESHGMVLAAEATELGSKVVRLAKCPWADPGAKIG